ncbi:MAG: TonB family protein [Bacteroidales bacterium]|jgi:TonB family protein|nr:TonB family protein [Bacteroidales bacterium]
MKKITILISALLIAMGAHAQSIQSEWEFRQAQSQRAAQLQAEKERKLQQEQQEQQRAREKAQQKVQLCAQKGGVMVNNVCWATRNVSLPGTFAATPESAGLFYQWNRKIGWSTTEPLINSNGGYEWSNSTMRGSEWEKANDPSPAGWRVPTSHEIQSLLDYNNVTREWVVKNGVTGRKFTDKTTGNSLFFPAAGYRDEEDGILNVIKYCFYWSTIPDDSNNEFLSYVHYYDNYDRNYGFTIRSVADLTFEEQNNAKAEPVRFPAIKAEFLGGEKVLMKWLAENTNYPVDALDRNVTGLVLVEFVVRGDGNIDNVRIIKSVYPSLDKEAMRVVKSMGKWKPAKNESGVEVPSYFTLPITFQLQKKSEK